MMFLLLFCVERHLLAAHLTTEGSLTLVSVEGSHDGIPCAAETTLKNALLDLQKDCQSAVVLLVADAHGRRLWQTLLTRYPEQIPPDWELRRWEGLASLASDAATPRERVSKLAPWLWVSQPTQVVEEARQYLQTQLAADATQWEAERARLLTELETLRQQRDALRRPDVERLASYLPALYRHFFSTVPPHDLALLCGHVQPPAVASPYPEPSANTLRRLQSDFRALPQAVQREIVRLALSLPQAEALQPRSEMQSLLQELSEF